MTEREKNQKIEKTSENQLSEVFSMDFISIEESIDKLFSVSKNLNKEVLVPFYKNYKEVNSISENYLLFSDYKEQFKSFLQNSLTSQNLNPDNIQKVGYKNGNILLDFGGEIGVQKIAFSDFQKELAFGDAKTDVKKVETQIQTLHLAMESIFLQNNGVFDELDLEDIVKPEKIIKMIKKGKLKGFDGKTDDEIRKLLDAYKGKHLLELREDLKLYQEKLVLYYDIIGETKKSVDLLEKELTYFAGIGDDYEGGARVFGLSDEQVDAMTSAIVAKKSVGELMEYIRQTNNKIDENSYLSEMVKLENESVIKNLTKKTFEKMKREGASTREFINFIRLITGRELTDKNGKEILKTKKIYTRNGFTEVYEKQVKVDGDFEQTDLANEALIYLMYTGGVVEKVSKIQDIELDDDIYTDKKKEHIPRGGYIEKKEKITSISTILGRSFGAFEKLGMKRGYLITNMGLEDIVSKEDISELDFNQMVLLGTLYRVSKDIESNISKLKGQTPEQVLQFFQQKNTEALKESFTQVNNSFEANFEASFLDWYGVNADEIDLRLEDAEVFDLYGKINGRGVFELADDNFFAKNFLTMSTGVVLAVGVLTAMVVLSPAIMAAGGWALVGAGAKIGLTTTIAGQLMDKKGYDTMKEAALGIGAQAAIDIGSSMFFTWGAGSLISKTGGRVVSNNLQKELNSGQLSEKTTKKLGKILAEGQTELGKNLKGIHKFLKGPERLYKPALQSVVDELKVLKNAGFSGELSKESVKYLGKYSALNGVKGNVSDMSIGIGDGIFASILYQVVDNGFIKSYFVENHYDPNSGETFINVKSKREESKKQEQVYQELREKYEKSLGTNKDSLKAFTSLSEEEKREVVLFTNAQNNLKKAEKKVFETLSTEEKKYMGNNFSLLFKQNNLYHTKTQK